MAIRTWFSEDDDETVIRRWFVEDEDEIYGLVIQLLFEVRATPNHNGVEIIPRIVLTQFHYDKHDEFNDQDLYEPQHGEQDEDQGDREVPDGQSDESPSE